MKQLLDLVGNMSRFLILCTALLVFPTSVWATQANGCPDFQPPSISVKQLVATPSVNDTLDLASIRQLAIDGGQRIAGSTHEIPVGVTAANLKLESQFEIHFEIPPNDRMVCAYISALELRIGFDDTVIYMAREVPFDSCGYKTVFDHEMDHVRTDRALIEAYAPHLPETLHRAVQEIGVIRASSTKAAEKEITNIVDRYFADLGVALSTVRQNQQMKIDTPEEYERLGKSCDGELGRLISGLKNGS